MPGTRPAGRRNQEVVARAGELLKTLQDNGIEPKGEPQAWFYDPPWTLPMLRRNEIAVAVDPSV